MELVEICSKNGNHYFHQILGQSKLVNLWLRLLARRRGKGIKHKFLTKD
jgi:hypothetical protein